MTETVVFPFSEDRSIIGLFENGDHEILAISNLGDLATWSIDTPTPQLRTIPNVTDIKAVAKKDNYLAVGGKGVKNNLKVFDLNADDLTTPLFSAKTTINTRLNSPFPVDIRSICFTSQDNHNNLATTSPDGQVFLYDFSRQASSILHHQVLPKKSLINSISRAEKDGSVIYTDVSGIIECYDLLKGKSYGRFKPQEGAVTSFVLSEGILITASKDRFLRIFNYSTRVLLHKIYLKHCPSSIIVTRQDWLVSHAQQYEDSEDEEVWEGMSSVPDKKRSKSS